MSYYIVDVEADGPIPGDYSMVCCGVVLFDEQRKFNTTFYGKTAPISENWLPDALAISGFTREDHLTFDDPLVVMREFKYWVNNTNSGSRPKFISDNNGFDWLFSHWYFEHFLGPKEDPFGWSSRNLNDVYHGLKANMFASFKFLRKTKHDHNPINDATGNAEVFAYMVDVMNLKI